MSKLSAEELQQLLTLKNNTDKLSAMLEINNLRYQNFYLTLLLKYKCSEEHVIDPTTGEISLLNSTQEDIK